MHCVRWPHFPYIFWRARMACAMMLRISQMSRMPFKLHLLLSFCSQRSTVGKQGDSDQDKKAYIQLFLPMRLPFPIRLSSMIFLRWCPLREKINKIKEHSCRHAHLPAGVCSTAMYTRGHEPFPEGCHFFSLFYKKFFMPFSCPLTYCSRSVW